MSKQTLAKSLFVRENEWIRDSGGQDKKGVMLFKFFRRKSLIQKGPYDNKIKLIKLIKIKLIKLIKKLSTMTLGVINVKNWLLLIIEIKSWKL